MTDQVMKRYEDIWLFIDPIWYSLACIYFDI